MMWPAIQVHKLEDVKTPQFYKLPFSTKKTDRHDRFVQEWTVSYDQENKESARDTVRCPAEADIVNWGQLR